MPRPREFDEREALDSAVERFHRHGYHATSTRDLGEALGLNPSSLYRAFGDKQGLFLRALQTYQDAQIAQACAALAAPGPVRERLRDWMLAMLDGDGGCLVVNTATELGTDVAPVAETVRTAFRTSCAGIAEALRGGVEAGELPADLDVEAVTELLFTTFTGLRVRQRAGEDVARLHAVVDRMLRVLDV